MSINKHSSVEEIYSFLSTCKIKENMLQKFKDEKIKGNELFYLTDKDYDEFGLSTKKVSLKKKLERIKNSSQGILDYNLNLDINSNEEDVHKFLKEEILLEENILKLFGEIDGKKLINLTEDDLKNFGLKLGERRKLLSYILSIKPKVEDKMDIKITRNSNKDEVCTFLKLKFNISEEIIDEFRDDEVDGNVLFSLTSLEQYYINEETEKKILDYINKIKSEEKNKDSNNLNLVKIEKDLNNEEEIIEQIKEEEKYKHFELIEITNYFTSEGEYNKCPFNKTEGFIELCNFMGIDNKENCKIIDFDQANKMNLKVSTVWGTIDALYEFFKIRKMFDTLEYFKKNKNKYGGIYLIIKEDKSFGYIIIWPGNMKYLYKKLEEPQKDLLLSLVRIGFSLCEENIICLTENQKDEFDFQGFKELESEDIPQAIESKLNIFEEETSYFKLGKDLEIKYEFNNDEAIDDFKLNNNSIFLNISFKDSIIYHLFDKMPTESLNFNEGNIIINKNFDLKGEKFYNFIKKFKCLKNFINENEYIEIQNRLNNNFNNNIICEFCKKKDFKFLYIFSDDEHCIHVAHYNCFPRTVLTKKPEEKLIQKNNKHEILLESLSFYYEQCKKKYPVYSQLNTIIKNYISELNNTYNSKGLLSFLKNNFSKILTNFLNDVNSLIDVEGKYILSILDNEISLLFKNWKNNVVTKINEFHYLNEKNIDSWIEFIYSEYDSKNKKYYFTYKKFTKDNKKDIIQLYNITKNDCNDYYTLNRNENKKWKQNEYEYEFENYFERDKNGMLIKKKSYGLNKTFLIELKEKNKILFNNCYDFCKDILIISRKDEIKTKYENEHKILQYIKVYYLDDENQVKFKNEETLKNIDNLLQIKIVPNMGLSPIYVLLFSEKYIYLMNMKDFIILDNINLDNFYKGYEFSFLQFLIYEKFLLIFYYNEKELTWNLDIFEIKYNKIIKTESSKLNLNYSSKAGKFSICTKIDKTPILYFCYFEDNKFKIQLKEIESSLSSLTTQTNSYKEKMLNLSEANCVINYFYHSFVKYPSIGALQYNYKINEKIKNIYIHSKGLKQTKKFEDYFKKLKEICIEERQFNSDDLKFEFKGIFRKDKIISDINLDDLIIKFIQVIPLQIAKIQNYYFKAMSEGKEIKRKELYEKYYKDVNDMNVQISIEDYANFINFGMKNAIFNYYDLPVVVLAFMGAQSIGKSTLSNELVESFFNVSGMRCTEGIWMAVSLFKGSKSLKKCEGKCKCCGEEICRLYIHNAEIRCICENCCCNDICCLYKEKLEDKIEIDKLNHNFCYKRCTLPLGHNNKCNIHCEKHRKNCACKNVNKNLENHICEISPYNHGFICVSLDFEGLGTFERSLEQDIDLSMVGAALANSLVLRADKTFDSFMQSRMMDWSEGSKKIKNFKNTHYFGGNIIFCQKDIPRNNYAEVQREYENKMKDSIQKWIEYENFQENINIKKNQITNRKQIFGIFSKYINSPTPIFNKRDYYKSLREGLIHIIIKNVLLNKSFPNYGTGREFMLYLQGILATVDIHDYNALENLAIDNLKKYLSENRIKAMEIFGIYPNNLEKNKFDDINDLENYLNLSLEKLKTSYITNSKLIIDEALNVNIISSNIKIGKIDNIKYRNYIININILENKASENTNENLHSYKLIIEGIKEFGLLLLIPYEYKEIFSIESIRKNLFSLWETICINLNLSNFEINKYFKEFISEIIKRRNNNIDKWLDNLILSFEEINTDSIKKYNFTLNDRWKICGEKCHKCYYSCTKILGHEKEHDCEFDHICHEKCQICDKIKCNEENCELSCKYKIAGHENVNNSKEAFHICSHFHKCVKNNECHLNHLEGCKKICQLEYNHEGKCFCKSKHLCDKECCYKNYSKDCEKKCDKEIDHEGEHLCKSKVHYCTRDCSLKGKSKGCINNGKCNLTLPHIEGSCQCKGVHYCIKECSLKDKARNCGEKCSLPYGHISECRCDKTHKCNEECYCKYKSRGCKEICNLDYGHEEQALHYCGEKHFCDGICSYKGKARNCKDEKYCVLEFNHKEMCTCGSEHLCPKKCSINNCGELCNLSYGHTEQNCNCNEVKKKHICQKECSLFSLSKEKTCNNKCYLEYGHEGNCFCEIPQENHKCNKNCRTHQKPCTLNANHEKKFCLCCECKCDVEDCQYKDISRNCQKKCGKNAEHKGPHLCEEKNHLCKEECDYFKKTKKKDGGCFGKCKLPAGHEGNSHFCENEKEKHKCPGKCSLSQESSIGTCNQLCDKSIDHKPPCICSNAIEKHICKRECKLKSKKGCKISCCLPVYHDTEDCICSSNKDIHLCDKKCSLYEKSKKGCNEFCALKYNHEGPCFCSFKKEEHICKGICCLKNESNAGCLNDCKLNVDHTGECFCQNKEEDHICNGFCSLKKDSREESCFDQCSLSTRHKGNCICYSKKHICNKDCDYKNKSRTGCFGRCMKETGHIGEHICDNELKYHKCNKKCHLFEKTRFGCFQFCDNIAGHNGECLCNSNLVHLCNGICYLSNICHKGNNKYCEKNANHTENEINDKHTCLQDNEHLCNKHCRFENVSRGCQIDCSLPYNHEILCNTECICKKPLEKHLCLEKCELCRNEKFCELEYGHTGHHLCDNEHNCIVECEEDGICEIITRKGLSKKKFHEMQKTKEKIEFLEKSEQTSRKLQCSITISPKKFDHKHKGKHKCQILIHKCGYKCKQCNRMCNLEYGHKSLHDTDHGHIENGVIFTEDVFANINYLKDVLDFKNEECADMFTCYQYCKDQGRGHIHIINESNINFEEKNLNKQYIKKLKDNIYGCKCEYFWVKILKFKYKDKFDKEQKISYNKCSAQCNLCKKKNKITYCELDLWHEPILNINTVGKDFWISKGGHKFICHHPIACHTIFIVDKSGSMGNNDIVPSMPIIKNNINFNNRFGKLIENMDNYIKKRKSICSEDVFSLISFSEKAEIIFQNISVDLNDENFNFIEKCMEKIDKCEGETEFYLGFIKSIKILGEINREKYKPVIILFSDGADQKQKETIEVVNSVSTFILIIN